MCRLDPLNLNNIMQPNVYREVIKPLIDMGFEGEKHLGTFHPLWDCEIEIVVSLTYEHHRPLIHVSLHDKRLPKDELTTYTTISINPKQKCVDKFVHKAFESIYYFMRPDLVHS